MLGLFTYIELRLLLKKEVSVIRYLCLLAKLTKFGLGAVGGATGEYLRADEKL